MVLTLDFDIRSLSRIQIIKAFDAFRIHFRSKDELEISGCGTTRHNSAQFTVQKCMVTYGDMDAEIWLKLQVMLLRQTLMQLPECTGISRFSWVVTLQICWS